MTRFINAATVTGQNLGLWEGKLAVLFLHEVFGHVYMSYLCRDRSNPMTPWVPGIPGTSRESGRVIEKALLGGYMAWLRRSYTTADEVSLSLTKRILGII